MKHTFINISLGLHSIHVDMYLATKKIPIHLPEPFNLKGYIRFPRLHYLSFDSDGRPNVELVHPIDWKECGESCSSDCYGDVVFLKKNKVYTPLINLREFTIELESKELLEEDTINGIKSFVARSVDNIMCILSVIAPEFISSKKQASSRFFVASCTANYELPRGNRMSEIGGVFFVPFIKDVISSSLLFPLIKNCHKELTLQYYMLAAQKEFLQVGDYRSCVLHAATIFESALLKLTDNYLKNNKTPEELIKFIHKKINGYRSFDDFYKTKIITKYPDEDKKVKLTTELRNKVIHEGRIVTKQEATDAYEASKSFLKFYNWPYFMDD